MTKLIRNRIVCVSGCLYVVTPASFHIQRANWSVLFLKERDAVFTNNYWRVVADVSTSCYDDVIVSDRNELAVVNTRKQDLTPMSELKHGIAIGCFGK
jgi:hypothetical protein